MYKEGIKIDNHFWSKVEKKTKVNKESIISLAQKLQDGNMKNEKTLNEVIDSLCSMTGKSIAQDKRRKIIDKIINDKVPKNIDKMF